MKKLGDVAEPYVISQFVSPAYLQEIGRVITQWSMMEVLLDGSIWQAGRVRNDIGRIFAAQSQVNSKLDTLGAILAQNHPLLGEQFALVSDYVRNYLTGRRNLVAHGFWNTPIQDDGSEAPEAILVKFTARGRLTAAHGKGMSIADLKDLSISIAEVSSWLLDLSNLLPKLRQRPGGLGHRIPDPQNPQDIASRKALVLQRPTLNRKVWESRKARQGKKERQKAPWKKSRAEG